MISQEAARQITQQFFPYLDPKEELETVLKSSQVQSTRFADNGITQNVHIQEAELFLHLQKENRQAKLRITPSAIKEPASVLSNLRQILQNSPDLKITFPFPKKELPSTENPSGFFTNTLEHTPEEKASVLEKLAQQAQKHKNFIAGNYGTEWGALAYSNSHGTFGYHPKTVGYLDMTTTSSETETEGGSLKVHSDLSQISPDTIFQESFDIAERAKNAISKEPGYYPVVLHPKATSDLLYFLVQLCFRTRNYQEGTSFLSHKLGKPLFSELLSVEENADHPALHGHPFDFEGNLRQKRSLIEQGVPKEIVHDQKTAHYAGEFSTGHASAPTESIGPVPNHLWMKGGEASLEELIARTEKGILVYRFHYTNVLNPIELLLTGMTRAGLFWIEQGKIAYPLKNFRFTINLQEVFRHIEILGQEQVTENTLFKENIIAPAMKVSRFHFSSQTDF